jgi:hypothetical protein
MFEVGDLVVLRTDYEDNLKFEEVKNKFGMVFLVKDIYIHRSIDEITLEVQSDDLGKNRTLTWFSRRFEPASPREPDWRL